MAYILMALMILMMRNTLAILMLFHQDIPNISLFPLMVDLVDLVTRDGIPCIRSIFGVYILLLDVSYRSQSKITLRSNEKKLLGVQLCFRRFFLKFEALL